MLDSWYCVTVRCVKYRTAGLFPGVTVTCVTILRGSTAASRASVCGVPTIPASLMTAFLKQWIQIKFRCTFSNCWWR